MIGRSTAGVASWAGVVCVLAVLGAGCEQGAVLRGVVNDTQGHALPGVAVTVRGTEFQDATDAVGVYEIRCMPGTLDLEFAKTGFTPGRLTVAVEDFDPVEAETVRLWNLPPEKGVYLLEEHRYQPLTRTEPKDYRIADGPLILATRKAPDCKTLLSAPFLVCHKLPPYDVRLHRLEQIEAALPEANAASEMVWAATDSIPIAADPLDEPERLLLALRPDAALTPGRYAIHWGALDGFNTIDSRIFLLEVTDPSEVESADEDEASETQPEEASSEE